MTDKEIEDIINDIIKEKGIQIQYHSANRVTVIHPEKGMATGTKDELDEAMRVIALKHKQK